MTLDTFTRRLNELYHPPAGTFTFVDMPEMRYMTIDGTGDPDARAFRDAVKWLFSVAHFIKPRIKETRGPRFVEPPLECLFWSEKAGHFASVERKQWKWRVMIVVLEMVTEEFFEDAVSKAEARRGPRPESLTIRALAEGRCVQTLHIGDTSGVAPVCRALYHDFLPARDLKPQGFYHEIYLTDPTRVAPERRRMVLRQPVG